MEFYSAYNRPSTIAAPHGDEEQISYIEVRDPVSGMTRLEETDRINISDYINSFLEDTKIENILERCMRGDTSALERMAGYYADVTNVPTSISEIYSNLKRCEADFAKLPAKMKEAFNNDPGQFIAGFGDGSVAEFLMNNAKTEVSDSVSDSSGSFVENVHIGGNVNVEKSE